MRSVAPLAGARIEIAIRGSNDVNGTVAPLAGARIEMIVPSGKIKLILVAPLAGARIEIICQEKVVTYPKGRSPRGSAD